MIYKCAKCDFVFVRNDEPSECPSCDRQNVIEANVDERKAFERSRERSD